MAIQRLNSLAVRIKGESDASLSAIRAKYSTPKLNGQLLPGHWSGTRHFSWHPAEPRLVRMGPLHRNECRIVFHLLVREHIVADFAAMQYPSAFFRKKTDREE